MLPQELANQSVRIKEEQLRREEEKVIPYLFLVANEVGVLMVHIVPLFSFGKSSYVCRER